MEAGGESWSYNIEHKWRLVSNLFVVVFENYISTSERERKTFPELEQLTL